MQYGFNTPGYGPYNCCGDSSTCTGPCPADFCSTPTGFNGWNGGNRFFGGNVSTGFNGYAPSFTGYNGVNCWTPGFTGFTGSNWGWNGGFTGYTPSFYGYNGWNTPFTGYTGYNGFNGVNCSTPGFTGSTGFTGYTGYANVPGTTTGNSTVNNCGPCWTGGCATEAA